MSASRLCMDDLEGSSRMMRLTIIFSSRVLNQPLAPRKIDAVEVGDEGIKIKAKRPTTRVMRP